jgi:hypothetical protein
MALMYGCLPPKNAPSLKFRDYRLENPPAHPAACDYLAALSDWQMLGNDSKGDCVAVTWANTRRLVSTKLGTPNYPTLDQVMTFYATQNPNGSDNGMDIQTALEDLVSAGGPDGVKAVGFMAVDYTNPEEVKAAINIAGSVWTGVNVLASNETQFGNGQPWDYTAGDQVVGGHSIITGGYGTFKPSTPQLSGDEKFITWAQETSFTDAFWSNQVTQAWVVIWPEHLGTKEFVTGMNIDTFEEDVTQITGTSFPAPK